MDDVEYPQVEAMESVLEKLGIDVASRYGEQDQDFEYTSCRVEELEAYVGLYQEDDTTPQEKRLLGCYFLECLNEHYQVTHQLHPVQNAALTLLHEDIWIHKSELAYFTDTSDPNKEHWWPITESILAWRENRM